MTSHSQGVQQLLAAEKRASEKVSEAKRRKARRLKEAKDEAQAEINKFKAEKERQFKEYEAAHMGSKEDIAAKIEQETIEKLNEMDVLVAEHKKTVINKLLELTFDVKPQVEPKVNTLAVSVLGDLWGLLITWQLRKARSKSAL